ncbi:MAG: cytosine methyltransferase [Alphaproteobacteria bacterium]|nr:cytosine methyltransferase [Alphaproteobacteria bacterium]MAS46455.1 cytosine methyltransferase [Alphaproteobacteria bacterium]MBN54502.1 cytosine methyltransferase [Alphaproteobacteria bacterium]OUT41949.1 MAG: hypothetical protein CBB62_06480 [Micavibrio sp. TMED2]|tara:strand:- start:5420 stop:6790 length:1371 start_codon:yes stop_codon:yes gene_type:complete
MKYWSICAGVCAASQAWKPKGWQPVLFSEIDPKPCAVLEHRFGAADARHTRPAGKPALWGDFTALRVRHLMRLNIELPDVIVGGTPCQDFSIAGARSSLTGSRGNLTLDFLRLCDAIDNLRRNLGLKPLIIIWENVPGVLNTRDNAFGHVLAGLAGCDTAIVPPRKWTRAGVVAGPRRQVSWRVLDAQYFGLAQRRERVFVVASAGTVSVAEILPEFDGLRRVAPPRREKGKDIAPTVSARIQGGGGLGTDFDLDGGIVPYASSGHSSFGDGLPSLRASERDAGGGSEALVAFGGGNTSGPVDVAATLTAHGNRIDFEVETFVATAYRTTGNDGAYETGDYVGALTCNTDQASHVIAFDTAQITSKTNGSNPQPGDPCHTLHAAATHHIVLPYAVRKLTPREFERLMGFEDDFTLVPYRGKPMSDSARYKMCGNSMAEPVMGWIQDRVIRAMELQR